MLIPHRALAVHKLTDDECARYALGAVRFETDGETFRAVATDSRVLGIVEWKQRDGGKTFPDESPVVESASVPAPLCERAKATITKYDLRHGKDEGRGNVELTKADDGVSLETRSVTGQAVFSQEEVEGKFPVWQDIRDGSDPKYDRTLRMRPALLKRVIDTLCEMHREADDYDSVIEISVAEDINVPIRFRTKDDGLEATVYAMQLDPDSK